MKGLFSKAITGEYAQVLYGRNGFINNVYEMVVADGMPENIALLGVKGVGKTVLLRAVFSKEKKRAYFDDARVVVSVVSIPSNPGEEMKDFYSYLNNAILDGLDAVETYDEVQYNALMAKIKIKKERILERNLVVDSAVLQSQLHATIESVREAGLKPLLVFDDFERFADSSQLKNEQYAFMRALADTQDISLFISTGKDLTKVSDEMKGSGFENIFSVERLGGIDSVAIEQWLCNATKGTDITIEDDVFDWIEEVSGGVPALVCQAGDIACDKALNGEVFSAQVFGDALYDTVRRTMQIWWTLLEKEEQEALCKFVDGAKITSEVVRPLIKKGYVKKNGSSISFVSNLFRRFVKEDAKNLAPAAKQAEEGSLYEEVRGLKETMHTVEKTMKETMYAVSETMHTVEKTILDSIDSLKLMGELGRIAPPIKEGSDEIDLEKYMAEISVRLKKYTQNPPVSKICEAWRISPAVWASYSDALKSSCVDAYVLVHYVYTAQSEAQNYSVVNGALGRFLESVLHHSVRKALVQYAPDVLVLQKGMKVSLSQCTQELTIGNFKAALEQNKVKSGLAQSPKYTEVQLSKRKMNEFVDDVEACRVLRNDAAHPGVAVSLEDKERFLNYLFLQENSMVDMMYKLHQL